MRQISIFLILLFTSSLAHSLQICGHRGERGLYPENTRLGFKKAMRYHIDCIDMDVVLTKDNIPVVYHDLRLNPDTTRDKHGNWVTNNIAIKELTFKELGQYNIGQINRKTAYGKTFPKQQALNMARIQSLDAILDDIQTYQKQPLLIQIELKTDPTDNASPDYKKLTFAVYQSIKRHHLEAHTKLQAFDWRCLVYLETLNTKISRAFLTEYQPKISMNSGIWTNQKKLKDYQNSLPKMIKAMHGNYWDAEDYQLSKSRINEAHQFGLKVCSWSNPLKYKINHHILEKKLIIDGVDCIITDRPDLFSFQSTHNK